MKIKKVKKLFVIVLLLFVTLTLTSCMYGEIYKEVDETNSSEEDDDLSIYPLIRMRDTIEYGVFAFNRFKLDVVVAKDIDNDCEVVINSVKVEGVSNIKFKELYKELDKNVEFNDEPQGENDIDVIWVFDEINDYNMRLNNKSKLKVTINVTIIDGEESVTKDIETTFNYRKYTLSESFDILMSV